MVNADLEEVGLTALENAIQIRPPGWPSQAVDPWMLREEVAKDPVAKTMVEPTELPITS